MLSNLRKTTCKTAAAIAVGICLTLGASPDSTSAQAEISLSAEAAANYHYVWRGITFVDGLVVQPGVSVGIAGLSAGVWANWEVSAPDGVNHFGMLGTDESGLGELDLWVEYGKSIETPGGVGVDLAAGFIYYMFPVVNGDNTHTEEVYASVGLNLPAAPVSPGLAVYYDFGVVDGLYIEPSVSASLPAGPMVSVDLGAVAGLSASQDGNFGENGFTHADLSAGLSLAAGPLSIAPALHFQISNAAATKIRSMTSLNSGSKIWFGVAVGWEGLFPTGS